MTRKSSIIFSLVAPDFLLKLPTSDVQEREESNGVLFE